LLRFGPLQEEAYWLLADIFQKQGKSKAYKTTLEKVIALDGRHKKEAVVRHAHLVDLWFDWLTMTVAAGSP